MDKAAPKRQAQRQAGCKPQPMAGHSMSFHNVCEGQAVQATGRLVELLA